MRERGKTETHTEKSGETQSNRPKPREQRTEQKGVRVSAYLLPDLCSLEEGGRQDRRREDQTNGLFKGQSLKGQKDKHHSYSRKTTTETNHH